MRPWGPRGAPRASTRTPHLLMWCVLKPKDAGMAGPVSKIKNTTDFTHQSRFTHITAARLSHLLSDHRPDTDYYSIGQLTHAWPCAVALSAAERPQTSILYRSLFTTGLCTAFADVGMGLVHSSILAAMKCHAVPRPLSTPKGKAWGKADGSAPGVHRLREGGPRASSIGARGTTRPHLAFFCFAAALLAAE